MHVTDTSEYVDDMAQRLKSVRDENPGLPMFLLGHSMVWYLFHCVAFQCNLLVSGLVSQGLVFERFHLRSVFTGIPVCIINYYSLGRKHMTRGSLSAVDIAIYDV